MSARKRTIEAVNRSKTQNRRLKNMKRIVKWLETRFSRPAVAVETDQHPPRVVARIDRVEKDDDEYTVEYSCGSDIYTSDDTVSRRQLSDLNEPLLDADEPAEFNPYNKSQIGN